MAGIGKILMMLGGILLLTGALLTYFEKIPFLGKLPGDIHVKKDNFEFYFPFATSILLGLLVSAVLWLSNFFGKKN